MGPGESFAVCPGQSGTFSNGHPQSGDGMVGPAGLEPATTDHLNTSSAEFFEGGYTMNLASTARVLYSDKNAPGRL